MLRITLRDEDDFNEFFFGINSPKEKLYNSIIQSIETALMHGDDTAHFAEITFLYGDVMDMGMEKRDWVENLDNALKYFEKQDMFEKCAMIVKLMERINES